MREKPPPLGGRGIAFLGPFPAGKASFPLQLHKGHGGVVCGMKLTLPLKLAPTAEQKKLLTQTMVKFNQACDLAAWLGLDAGVYTQVDLHDVCYERLRKDFAIPSQMAIRAMGKNYG